MPGDDGVLDWSGTRTACFEHFGIKNFQVHGVRIFKLQDVLPYPAAALPWVWAKDPRGGLAGGHATRSLPPLRPLRVYSVLYMPGAAVLHPAQT